MAKTAREIAEKYVSAVRESLDKYRRGIMSGFDGSASYEIWQKKRGNDTYLPVCPARSVFAACEVVRILLSVRDDAMEEICITVASHGEDSRVSPVE